MSGTKQEPKVKADASPGVKRVVQQRFTYDCSVAVLSMLMNIGYEQVTNYFTAHGKDIPLDGLWVKDAILIADWYGIHLEHMGRGLRDNPGYVVVPSINQEGKLHALYYDGAKIFDPIGSRGKNYHTEMARREMKYIYEVTEE